VSESLHTTSVGYPREPDLNQSHSIQPRVPFTAQSMEASLTVADVARSVAWYRDVLGFTVDRDHVREGRLIAVSLSAGAIRILVTQDNGAHGENRAKGAGFSLRFTTTQDIDMLAAAAKQAGAAFDTEPMDALGFRIFRLRDPDGFRLVISSVGQV
jgi:catechol 2,3-dioxygenase-like lactoylglutathione lyase family enzyme